MEPNQPLTTPTPDTSQPPVATPAPQAPAPPTASPVPQVPAAQTPVPVAPGVTPAKSRRGLLFGGIGAVIILILVFVVAWVLLLSPQAQAKRLSNHFMASITTGKVSEAVKLTGDPTSNSFLSGASSKLHGSYSMSQSAFKNGTGYYLYSMSGAQEKYARTIIAKSNGKREVTSLVYSNSALALIPGAGSSSSSTSSNSNSGSSSSSSSSTTSTGSLSTYTNGQFHFSFQYPSSWGTVTLSTTNGTQGGASGISSYNGTFSNKSSGATTTSGSDPYIFRINSFKWSVPYDSNQDPITSPTLTYRVVAVGQNDTSAELGPGLNTCERIQATSESCTIFSSIGDWTTVNHSILAKQADDLGVGLFVPLQTFTGENYPTVSFYSTSMGDYSAFQQIAQSFQGELTTTQLVN